jgi:acetyl esterase/lipase
MHSLVYKTVGSCQIELDVYPADRAGPRPVVVWIHGGALILGGRGAPQVGLLAAIKTAGYGQVSIDYRLAPETKLPDIVTDVVDAIAWVRTEGKDRFEFDPDRLAVLGHSAGGYLTLMTGFRVAPRPRALVSFFGYGDIVGDWYSKPDEFYRTTEPLVSREAAFGAVGTLPTVASSRARRAFYIYCRQNGIWPEAVGGINPASDPRFFDAFCPEKNVGPDCPPTLLLHGTADTDVPYQRSVDMALALARGGVEHTAITVPDGGHGFDRAVTEAEIASSSTEAAHAVGLVLPFLARWLGD